MSLLGLIPATHLLAEASLLTFLTPLFSFCLCSGEATGKAAGVGVGAPTNGRKKLPSLFLGIFCRRWEQGHWERLGLLPGLHVLLACSVRRLSEPSLATQKLPSRGCKTGSQPINHLSAREAVAQFRKCELKGPEVFPDLTQCMQISS